MNSAAQVVRAAADANAAKVVRPNILTVPQCSGCGRPRKEKIATPFGTRHRFNRLKMTTVPGVVDVLPRQASGAMVRRRAVRAPLCKACRIVAFGSDPIVDGKAVAA